MKQQSYKKFECENCGAPLSRTENRGEYRCDFCGAVYINEEHLSEESVGPQRPVSHAKPELPVSKPDYSVPSFSSSLETKPKGKTGKIIGLLIFLLIACGVISFCRPGDESRTENSNTILQIPTPEMVSALPTNPIPFGEGIAYQGWELKVNPNLSAESGEINFSMELTNWTGEQTYIRFKPADIEIMDDAGNSYAIDEGNCDRDQLFFEKEVTFEVDETIEIMTSSGWCSSDDEIPSFSGTIVSHADKLFIIMKNFGPFSQVTFVIDL